MVLVQELLGKSWVIGSINMEGRSPFAQTDFFPKHALRLHANKHHPRVRTIDEYHTRANETRLGNKAIDRGPYKQKKGVRLGGQEAGPISLDLLLNFFSLLQLFFPELGTDEKKFWECNAAKKKGRGQGRLPTSNFKQVDA
jgi:hypothetical protein